MAQRLLQNRLRSAAVAVADGPLQRIQYSSALWCSQIAGVARMSCLAQKKLGYVWKIAEVTGAD